MKLKLICIFVAVSSLFACSTIKEYFPDKEKDYQLTSEIPALTIPEDLNEDVIQSKPKIVVRQQIAEQDIETVANEKKEKKLLINVDLVEYTGGATRIQIEDSLVRSWYYVGKALSRNSIEITQRIENQRVYYVQYDPEFEKIEDGSLWDEVLFIFADDPAQEKEYRVKLAEKAGITEVFLLDENDNPLLSQIDLTLLKLLHKTIKQDLTQ